MTTLKMIAGLFLIRNVALFGAETNVVTSAEARSLSVDLKAARVAVAVLGSNSNSRALLNVVTHGRSIDVKVAAIEELGRIPTSENAGDLVSILEARSQAAVFGGSESRLGNEKLVRELAVTLAVMLKLAPPEDVGREAISLFLKECRTHIDERQHAEPATHSAAESGTNQRPR